jgi:hypothetical protein
MTATGLQQYIDINLDGTRTFNVDIAIYSPDPSRGVICTSEVMEASVEAVTGIAESTLQGIDQDSIITFKFPKTDDTIECFRDEEGIVCRKAQVYRS